MSSKIGFIFLNSILVYNHKNVLCVFVLALFTLVIISAAEASMASHDITKMINHEVIRQAELTVQYMYHQMEMYTEQIHRYIYVVIA